MTKYHRLGDFIHRHLFLTVLETRKSKIKVDSVSGEVPSSGLQMATSMLCLPRLEVVRSVVSPSPYDGSAPSMAALPS